MKPSLYHADGYTCGEAIIKAYNEKYNEELPVRLGSGMGTGYASGSLCGAVAATGLVLSYLHGRENNDERNEAKKHSKDLINEIRNVFGSELCLPLKQVKVKCADIIDYSFEQLENALTE